MIKMRRSVSGRAANTTANSNQSASASTSQRNTDDRLSVISGNLSNASTLTHDTLISAKSGGSLQLRKFKAGVGPVGAAREVRESVKNVIATPSSSIRSAELHLQFADSCRGSAAQRSAWFDRLAEAYNLDRWFAEAAVCYAHSAAIIAKELEEKGVMKIDWSVFNWISKEIIENERQNPKDPETVQQGGFTTENLTAKIEKTVRALNLAERFEAIGPLYRLLIPILERKNNFNSLISIYAELHQAYSRAAEIKVSGKRHLGTYFRVRFYGKKSFETDHDTDWVYREAGLTSLAEISLKLREQVKTAVGHDKVQVEPEYEFGMEFDPNVAYVQVTHVEPLLANGRSNKDFWTHTNVCEFVYESGIVEINNKLSSMRIRGSEPPVTKQALKRTILKVEGSFPATRRRLRVMSRREQIYSPLDFACQKLLGKAAQIRAILASSADGRQIDVKGLQLLLQGAIMPTVNAGPLVLAEAFTKEEEVQRYGQGKVAELREAFRTLMSSCDAGLRVNKTLIGPDQQMYHDVLMNSFDGMHERLQTFFKESLRSPTPPPVEERKSLTLPKTAINVLDSIGGVN
ncbi:hypothetical protein WR25_13022 [Diploscapter pachys]|uniref:DOCKER domain-containing protein n=1 Tax=Diploscapter pachys TaxID=2018661 RepID=A0A2A2JUM2_9BILA|nr:hypothetical protein WR25_13022 [Diploscapter pachys]